METLLITKNGVPYSDKAEADSANSLTLRSELDELSEGSIVAFEENGTRVTSAGSFTKTDSHGKFAVGMPAGYDTKLSPLVNWSTLSYNKNVYAAAAAAVVVFGGDGQADLTSGSFTADQIGTQFIATVASTGGDFASELIDDSTGVAISGELVVGQTYTVFAAGTPTWGGGTLSSTDTGVLAVGTKAVGAEYGVTVVDLEKETWERNKYDVTLTLTSASMTDAQMLAAVVAAFNAHPKASLIATAAVSTGDAGIIFTGVNAGEDFTILPQGLFYGTSVDTDGSGASIVSVKGEGTNAQILKLESETSSIEGRTATAQSDDLGEIWKVPSVVESGVNYTVYVLEWSDQREVAYPSNNANPHIKRLNIAVPSADSTMITALDNLLDDLVA